MGKCGISLAEHHQRRSYEPLYHLKWLIWYRCWKTALPGVRPNVFPHETQKGGRLLLWQVLVLILTSFDESFSPGSDTTEVVFVAPEWSNRHFKSLGITDQPQVRQNFSGFVSSKCYYAEGDLRSWPEKWLEWKSEWNFNSFWYGRTEHISECIFRIE